MCLDATETPVLYSTGTRLAYTIANRYYGGKHFVWCTTKFHSRTQPPTSDPQSIARTYFEHAIKGDQHSHAITDNIAGILRGAEAKRKEGVISCEEYDIVHQMLNLAEYKVFLPVLIIIDTKAVQGRCVKVTEENRASKDSIEYQIPDLSEGEYQIIEFDKFLNDIIPEPYDGIVKVLNSDDS